MPLAKGDFAPGQKALPFLNPAEAGQWDERSEIISTMSPLPEQQVDVRAASPSARTQEPTVADVGVALVRDLRSPLTTIERYLDLLGDGDVGALTVEQLEYLDVARRNVQRVSALVNDWLDVTRLEAGKLSLVCGAVNLSCVVERVLVHLQPSIEAKRHQVTVEAPAEPILAYADERAMLRVVDNLLSNAHTSTPPPTAARFGSPSAPSMTSGCGWMSPTPASASAKGIGTCCSPSSSRAPAEPSPSPDTRPRTGAHEGARGTNGGGPGLRDDRARSGQHLQREPAQGEAIGDARPQRPRRRRIALR